MALDDRFRLRPLEEKDLELLQKWNKPEVRGPYQEFHFQSPRQLRREFEEHGFCTDSRAVLMIDGRNLGPVGVVYMTRIREGVYALGLVLGEQEHHNQGIGTAALRLAVDHIFCNYPAMRIEAETDQDNRPAQRVLEKAGFSREAQLRSWRFHHGQWRDFWLFSVLRWQWEQDGAADPREQAVRSFWDAFGRGDYAEAGQYAAADLEVAWPNTGEMLRGRDAFVTVNTHYPGQWRAALETLRWCGSDIVTVSRIVSEQQSLRVISWFTFQGDKIKGMVEYFADDGPPPQWRIDMDIADPLPDGERAAKEL